MAFIEESLYGRHIIRKLFIGPYKLTTLDTRLSTGSLTAQEMKERERKNRYLTCQRVRGRVKMESSCYSKPGCVTIVPFSLPVLFLTVGLVPSDDKLPIRQQNLESS